MDYCTKCVDDELPDEYDYLYLAADSFICVLRAVPSICADAPMLCQTLPIQSRKSGRDGEFLPMWSILQVKVPLPKIDEPAFFQWMRWAAEHSLWPMISTVVLLVTVYKGWRIFVTSTKRVRNLNFFVRMARDPSQSATYPLKVYVEIRNYTGRSVVITSPYFKYGELKPDPNARGDSPEAEYEVKFPNESGDLLSEVEFLLRHQETTATWIPLDSAHTDEEVSAAIKTSKVGELHCTCTWLQDKPNVHRLVRKI